MTMKTQEFLALLADAFSVDPEDVKETSTFDEIGSVDSISRLSMISILESNFGSEAVIDELMTVSDVPTLLSHLRSRGFVD